MLVLAFVTFLAQRAKNLPAMQETPETGVRLGWEDPLEEEMSTRSSILVWRIPWKEETGGLQSIGLRRVRHAWTTKHRHLLENNPLIPVTFFHWATLYLSFWPVFNISPLESCSLTPLFALDFVLCAQMKFCATVNFKTSNCLKYEENHICFVYSVSPGPSLLPGSLKVLN